MEQSANNELKRYNLVLTADLFNELQVLADREGTTVVELMRRAFKILLLISKSDPDPMSEEGLFLKTRGKERKLLII